MVAETVPQIQPEQCEAVLAASKTGAQGTRCPAPAKWVVQGGLLLCGQHAWNKPREPLATAHSRATSSARTRVATIDPEPPAEPPEQREPEAPRIIATIRVTAEAPEPARSEPLSVRHLREMVSMAKQGVSGRCHVPVQSNIRVETAGDQLRLTASDLQGTVSCWTPGFEAAAANGIAASTVPPEALIESLKALPIDNGIRLTPLTGMRQPRRFDRCPKCGKPWLVPLADGETAHCEGCNVTTGPWVAHGVMIESGTWRREARGLSAADFEVLNVRVDPERRCSLELDEALLNRIAEVASAASKDLFDRASYVAIQPAGPLTRVIATDTWRGAIDILPVRTEGKLDDPNGWFLVPLFFLKRVLAERLRIRQAPITLTYTPAPTEGGNSHDGVVEFSGPTWRMSAMAGPPAGFPSLAKAIPEAPLANAATVDCKELRPALVRSKVVAKGRDYSATLWCGTEEIIVTADSEDGFFWEPVPAALRDWQDQPEGFGVNVNFLLDSLPKSGMADIRWDKGVVTKDNKGQPGLKGLVTVQRSDSPMFWVLTQRYMRNPFESWID